MELLKRKELKTVLQPIMSKWMKKQRQSLGFSQEQMARRYGMSVRSYIDLEHGICFPSATTLAQLLTTLSGDEAEKMLAEIKISVDAL